MPNIPLCFDKFVISKQSLIALNKTTIWSNIPSCENYRKAKTGINTAHIDEIDEMLGDSGYDKFNIRNHCINEDLKCDKHVYNIKNEEELYKYLDDKTKIKDSGRKNYSTLIAELAGFFSILNTDRKTWNKKTKKDKKTWNDDLRNLLREILSLENDNDIVDKIIKKIYNTSSNTSTLYNKFSKDLKEENKKSESLGENKEEDLLRRDQSYKKSMWMGYNNLFYSILIIVSFLFLKCQLK